MQRTDITFRLAHARDAETIACMSRDLIESGLEWSWTPTRIARSIAHADTNVLVAGDGERIVGFAIMHYGASDAHLNLLAVRALRQRRGIGRGLIDWLEESARTAGVLRVHLEVRALNHGARAFYRALGYREVGELPNYYSGRETAVRMLHDLRRTHASKPEDNPGPV